MIAAGRLHQVQSGAVRQAANHLALNSGLSPQVEAIALRIFDL